jgi:hypothetical protein
MAALTLSDIASLVAVLGILAVPLLSYLGVLSRRTAALSREVQAAHEREAALAGIIARGFASTANVDAFALGLIERVQTARFDELDSHEVADAHRELLDGVRRAWAEASVMSDDGPSRASALRQLAARLGDEDSARIAKLASDRYSQDG